MSGGMGNAEGKGLGRRRGGVGEGEGYLIDREGLGN